MPLRVADFVRPFRCLVNYQWDRFGGFSLANPIHAGIGSLMILTTARCPPPDHMLYSPILFYLLGSESYVFHRVRRIRGQIEAVERALDQEIGCADVMQLIAAARGAINGLMGEVMEDHIRMHVIDPGPDPNSERAQATEELIDVVRSYLK
jgi:DNA-binding FrmR family transcriptional regulator